MVVMSGCARAPRGGYPPEGIGVAPGPGGFRAGDLIDPLPPIGPGTPCTRVYDIFAEHPEWPGLAVVSRGSVIGMIDRPSLFATFAKPLLRDLYERRPISLLMDRLPLVVDRDLSLDEVSQRIAHDKPDALISGFVVTERGEYRGIGTALGLMARSVDQARAKNRELDEARRAAEAANTAKSSFLANMSHELRTPLNAVIGFAELIESEMFGPLGHERYREYAGDIHVSGRHLLDLINDLLDLSKAEANRLELNEGKIDVRGIVGSCVRLMNDLAERGGVTLRADVPMPPPPLWGDERKLRQMVLNLVSNAIKFTPKGGSVTVSAGVADHGALELAVTDTGIGMTPENQIKAMEPFSQIDNAMNRRQQGTGLGLPLTRRLIELHGGSLRLDSVYGRGTTIVLTFPAERVENLEVSLASA
ncbi:hypothetical protein N825_18005 [Skermanella stibiiresistens SB22]|uniref:histidine kinase n=2 Tax=Skermanella TaxID=204447 RepID=W9GY06_9PROT|nr:hypothetical protein N825_18005 [Skermanella stibiiresistens SB22]